MRAMKSCVIVFGHTALHSYWLVQLPKPAASIVSTIASTRRSRSGWPCGMRPRCETFAATKSILAPVSRVTGARQGAALMLWGIRNNMNKVPEHRYRFVAERLPSHRRDAIV